MEEISVAAKKKIETKKGGKIDTLSKMAQELGLKPSDVLKVYDIPLEKVRPNDWNPYERTEEEFTLLLDTIEQEGWDQPIVVVPDETDPGYFVVIKGEGRWGVARALEQETIPAVIRTDWETVDQMVMTVRDNEVKGHLQKSKFNTFWSELNKIYHVDTEQLRSEMGLFDDYKFNKLLTVEKQKEQKSIEELADDAKSSSAKIVDSLTDVVQSIFAEYGTDSDKSFIFFYHKGKPHMLIEANRSMIDSLNGLTSYLKENGEDINDFLTRAINEQLDGSFAGFGE